MEDTAGGAAGTEVTPAGGVVSASSTGQIVVEMAIVLVVTEPTGQLCTVGGHLVMVSICVV